MTEQTHTPPAPARRRFWPAAILVVSAYVIAAAGFLPHETIWIDETTQLTGLAMGPGEIADWLAAPASRDLGVPGDRMPPLSYWVGQLWAGAFGAGETSLRILGVVCTALAVLFTMAAARRAFGPAAGVVAGLLFGLSANVVSLSVSIRAYPLLLLASAAVFFHFVSLLRAPAHGRRRHWLGLTFWLIAAMGTHFFGVVLAGGVGAALLLARILRRESVRPVLAMGVVLAAAGCGLLPYIGGAADISQGGETPAGVARDRGREVAQFLYRLAGGHPALAVHPAVGGAALLGFAVLAAAAVPIRLRRPGPREALAAALVLGLGVSIAANFLTEKFQATKFWYALWALPALAIALSAGVAAGSARVRRVAVGAAVVVVGCQIAGDIRLWINGDAFSHGPHRGLAEIIARSGEADVAVLHELQDTDSSPYISIPLRYAYAGRMPEWRAELSANGIRARPNSHTGGHAAGPHTGGQAASGTQATRTGGQAASGTQATRTGGQAAGGTQGTHTGGQAASGTRGTRTGGQAASGTQATHSGGQAAGGTQAASGTQAVDDDGCDVAAIPCRVLLVVRSANCGAAEIAERLRAGDPPRPPGPAARALADSGRWLHVESHRFGGYHVADVDVFTRIDRTAAK